MYDGDSPEAVRWAMQADDELGIYNRPLREVVGLAAVLFGEVHEPLTSAEIEELTTQVD